MKRNQKMFIIRKYIKACSAKEAIAKEKTHDVDEVYIDDDWKNSKGRELAQAIGFVYESNDIVENDE